MEELLKLLKDFEIKALEEAGRIATSANGKKFLTADKDFEVKSFDEIGMSIEEAHTLLKAKGIKIKEGIEQRIMRFVGSDETVDKQGDIVKQNFVLENFNKNSVFMFNHDYFQPPIGVILQVTTEGKEGSKKTLFDAVFADGDVSAFADSIFRLYDNGFMKAVSIGFIPLKVTRVEDEDDRKDLGLGRFGVVFDKSELLELSAVPIGANNNALLNAYKGAFQKGLFKTEEVQSIVILDKRDNSNVIELKEQLKDVWNKIDEESKFKEVSQGVLYAIKEIDPPNFYQLRERVFESSEGKEIKLFMFKEKEESDLELIRFTLKGFTLEEAKAWVKENEKNFKTYAEESVIFFKEFDSIQGFVEKAGAVLNKKNKELLNVACKNVTTVLSNAQKEDQDEEEPKSLTEIVRDEVKAAVDAAMPELEKSIAKILLGEDIKVFLSKQIADQLKEPGTSGVEPKEEPNEGLYGDLLETAGKVKEALVS